MELFFYVILFCLLLLILTEPLYIRMEKSEDTIIALHFVFLSLHLSRGGERREDIEAKKTRKISPKSYIRAWLKLRKRVKIKIDAIYLPAVRSPYTQALLCGLFPALLEGERAYHQLDKLSFAIHIETTLPDCLILFMKAYILEKKKEKVW